MGMYTIAIDEGGNRWQFKTGDDQCEMYRLGEPIPAADILADPHNPGSVHLGDGIYDACGESAAVDGAEAWLVIHNGTIVEIVPYVQGEKGIEPSEASLFKKWNIQPPDTNLWTPHQWAEHAIRGFHDEWEKRALEAEMDGMSATERLVFLSSLRTRRMIQETGFLRAILPIGALENPTNLPVRITPPLPKFMLSRDGRTTGEIIGTRPCRMEGCRGTCYIVRWPDGKRTYPCGKGVKGTDKANTLQLE